MASRFSPGPAADPLLLTAAACTAAAAVVVVVHRTAAAAVDDVHCILRAAPGKAVAQMLEVGHVVVAAAAVDGVEDSRLAAVVAYTGVVVHSAEVGRRCKLEALLISVLSG